MTIARNFRLFLAVAGFAIAQVAVADTCNLDNLIGSANPGNSGQGTEEGLLEGILGENVTFDYRIEKGQTGFNVTACDNNANWFFISVAPDAPGYFVLKLGDGGTNAVNDTFFFENVAELSMLVFSSAQVECLIGGPGCPGNTNTGRLSHYSLYDGTSRVPEPGTLALFGLAAFTIALTRRRRHQIR